ncbi:MAG TPA: hypothetical protein VG148_10450 [Pyrinomonadaceae bacterium]|nr:hypothetical protein [Pyrinomonadaceae bacterium]
MSSTHIEKSGLGSVPDGLLAQTPAGQADAVVHRQRPAPTPIDPTIKADQTLVVVKRPHTSPKRVKITVKTSRRFTRDGTLTLVTTPTSGEIAFFTTEKGQKQFVFTNSQRTFTATELSKGVDMFAEGVSPSSNLGEFRLVLTLAPGPTPVGPDAEVALTAVRLSLSLSPPRAGSGAPFTPLPEPPPPPPPAGSNDKWFGGAVVNAQDTGNSQPRALLVVGQVIPTAFAGDLVLRQVSVANNIITGRADRVRLFDDETPGPRQTPPVNEAPHPTLLVFNATDADSAVGRRFFVEGVTPSAALRDTGFQLGINGVEDDGDRVALAVAVAPVVSVDSPIVVVRKAHTTPARRVVTLRTSGAFSGTGTLTRSTTGPVRIFDSASGTTEVDLSGAGRTFAGDQLSSTEGVRVFAESVLASGSLNDYTLTLTLTGGQAPVGSPATLSLTAVEFTLDIFHPRAVPGANPPALAGTDKIDPGRFLQLRNPANSHTRAKIVVRRPNPLVSVTLELSPVNNQVRAFTSEVPGAGQTQLSNPHTILTSLIPPGGAEFFVEGISFSGAARDTGYRLGIQGLENEADRVVVTVFNLDVVSNVFPFGTAVEPVQIEGILNASLSGFRISNLIGTQSNSLFRARVEMPGFPGNSIQAMLVSTATPAELPQPINLFRNSGDRFLSRPILAIPEAILRAGITFGAPQELDVVRARAGGTFRLDLAGSFSGAGVRLVRVRGRVVNIAAQAFINTNIDLAAIRRHIRRANQLWAQAGIEVKERSAAAPVAHPSGLNDIDFTLPFASTLTTKERRLLGLLPNGPSRSAVLRDMNVYYVRRINGPPAGVAYSGESYPGLIADPNNTAIAIEGPVISDLGLAHELGHHFLRAWGDEHKDQTATPPTDWPAANIMHPADTGTATTIDRTQVLNILNGTSGGNHPCIVFEP